MAKFTKFSISYSPDGGTTSALFYFVAPPGSYQNIDTIAGVQEIDPAADDYDMPPCKIEELLRSPVAVRRTLRIEKTGGKITYKKVIVSSNKAAAFENDAIGKDTNLGIVKAVVEPLDAVFS